MRKSPPLLNEASQIQPHLPYKPGASLFAQQRPIESVVLRDMLEELHPDVCWVFLPQIRNGSQQGTHGFLKDLFDQSIFILIIPIERRPTHHRPLGQFADGKSIKASLLDQRNECFSPLAIQVARHVGTVGRVAGIDPSSQQIARARAKAARRGFAIEFQIGVIEQLPFPDRSFDVVFSTLMIHHLPAPLKRQGLAEIVRVLKPEGRLLLADFTHRTDRVGRAAHFHAGGSRIHDLVALLKDTGFTIAETEEVQPRRFSAFPGAAIIQASISKARHESAELR